MVELVDFQLYCFDISVASEFENSHDLNSPKYSSLEFVLLLVCNSELDICVRYIVDDL